MSHAKNSQMGVKAGLSIVRRTAALGVLATGTCLWATGCGWGVANLAPAATKPVTGIPSGPILGYIFSAGDGTLRPMLGVKGSSQMGQSIVPAGVYVAGAASVAGSAGLLEDERGSLFAFNLPLSQPIHVADGFGDHVQIAFASSGHTAIAYKPGGSSIALVTGLPSSPQVQTIAAAGTLSVASAVVNDSGLVVLATQGSPSVVGTLQTNGQFSRMATVAEAGGLNFVPGSDDVLLADHGRNAAFLLHNVSTSPSLQALNATGANQPLAIAATQDRRWAVIANGGDQGLVRIDLKADTPASKLSCSCQPSQLTSLAGSGTFRVNALGTGPVWMVDLSGSAPQLLFVPAMAAATP